MTEKNPSQEEQTEEELFPIEKNIPIENFPSNRKGSSANYTLFKDMPFGELSIGDSFYIHPRYNIPSNSIASLCHNRGNSLGRAFSFRLDRERGGWRVWRVATPKEKRLFDERGEPK